MDSKINSGRREDPAKVLIEDAEDKICAVSARRIATPTLPIPKEESI